VPEAANVPNSNKGLTSLPTSRRDIPGLKFAKFGFPN
jgi:hypothetical protein